MPVEFKDYYNTLGVSKDASKDEIKRAFRDLARKCHPDLAKPEDRSASEARFKEINEAYEVLKDPEKRKKYDQLGSDWDKYDDEFFKRAQTAGAGAGGSDFGGFSRRSTGEPGGYQGFEYHFGGTGFSDFFERFFGGSGVDPFSGFGPEAGDVFDRQAGGRSRASRGADVEAELMVTLEEAFSGATRRISLRKTNPIDGVEKTHTINVKIPAGVREGQRIRLGGQGQPSPSGGPAGDLFLRARFAQHPYFTVKDSDLHYELNLAPWEAALGALVEVPTLKGTARVTVKPGTQSGQQLRLKGHGMPRGGGRRGDLLADVSIKVPANLNQSERELWERLREGSHFNPRTR